MEGIHEYFTKNYHKICNYSCGYAAGRVFYRCSREQTEKPRNEKEQVLVLSPEEETAQTGTSDSDTHDFPEPLTSEEHLSREETPESVVIEEPSCFVHICGAVKTPGVYELSQGSRIYQAVEMAGGFLPEADQSFLNLAQPVADGMKITVWTRQEAETAAQGQGIAFPGTQRSQSGRGIRNKAKSKY